MYNLRTRIVLEIIVLGLAGLLLPFVINYIVLIQRAPPMGDEWPRYLTEVPTPFNYGFQAKRGSIAMYILPPLLTLIISATNIFLYRTRVPPLVYGVIMTSIQTAGWGAVIGIWGDCHLDTYMGMAGSGDHCWEHYLMFPSRIRGDNSIEGVPVGWFVVLLVIAIGITCVYLSYLVIAARDFHLAKRGGLVHEREKNIEMDESST